MTDIFPIKNRPVWCPFCSSTARVSVSQKKPPIFKVSFHCKVCNKKIVKNTSEYMVKLLNIKNPEELFWAGCL